MDFWFYAALAAAVVIFIVMRRRRAKLAAQQEIEAIMDEAGRRPPPRVSASTAATRDVAVVRPSLPAGRSADIVAALQSGAEPDESWIRGTGGAGGEVQLLPFSARFQSVSGESFQNPDGVSRQSILSQARPGSEVFLVPEPTNRFDADAIAVYLDLGGGNTGQLGYLPKDNSLKGAVAANKVIAWLARVDKREVGAPLGAVLYVITANGPIAAG